MNALLVILGAVVGAPVRYLTDRALHARAPLGTLLVNVFGCLVLGLVTGAGTALPGPWHTLAGTGFCGALSTYSTMSYETLRLIEEGRYRRAAGYIGVSLALGLAAAAAGFAAASYWTRTIR